MFEILMLGFLTFVAFSLVIVKIGLGRFVKLGWVADLGISIFMGFIFVGTFTGMATGLIAGILLSLFLTVCRWFRVPAKAK